MSLAKNANDNPKGFCSTICQQNGKKLQNCKFQQSCWKWPRMNFDEIFFVLGQMTLWDSSLKLTSMLQRHIDLQHI